jgi:hypothetical protein
MKVIILEQSVRFFFLKKELLTKRVLACYSCTTHRFFAQKNKKKPTTKSKIAVLNDAELLPNWSDKLNLSSTTAEKHLPTR